MNIRFLIIAVVLAVSIQAVSRGEGRLPPQVTGHTAPTSSQTDKVLPRGDAYAEYRARLEEVSKDTKRHCPDDLEPESGEEAGLHIFDGLDAAESCLHGVTLSDKKGMLSTMPKLFTGSKRDSGVSYYLNLKVLVLFYRNTYAGGFTDDEIAHFRDEIEWAREFYWRNSRLKVNLELHYLDIWTYRPESDYDNYGILRSVVSADMIANGIVADQYDGAFGVFQGKGGWFCFGRLPDMGKTRYSNTIGGCNRWAFLHEFHHQIEGVFNENGYGYPGVHPNFWGDYGGNYELNAYILRMWPPLYWLSLGDVWGEVRSAVDTDMDGVPDNAPDVPIDEARFGSSPAAVDTDGDGLRDRDEIMAGIFSASDPQRADTDGDGVVDGGDLCPLQQMVQYIPTFTPVIDGAIEGGWYHAGSGVVNASPVDIYTAWDQSALYLGLSFAPWNMPTIVTVHVDANNDGYRRGPDGPEGPNTAPDNYEIRLNTVTGAVEEAHLRWPEVVIWSSGKEWCEDVVYESDIAFEVDPALHNSLEIGIPRNDAAYLVPGVGDTVGLRIYFDWDDAKSLFEADTYVDFTMVTTVPGDYAAPAQTVLLEPTDGAVIPSDEIVQFNWVESIDYGSSGLYGYDFELDDNLTFESPEIYLEGFPTPSTEEYLASGDTWFWRVRARDNIANVSRYSATGLFTSLEWHVWLNGSSFKPKSTVVGTFVLDSAIERPFTVYAVLIMPGGEMVNAANLKTRLQPLVVNYPGLNPPFSYQFLSVKIPKDAPKGGYEAVVAFFDPSKPITARGDAFLDASAEFTIR